MIAARTSLRIALLAALVLLAACTRPTPEARLRGRLADLEHAIDARDAVALKGLLADDFIGPDGLDKAGAVRLAQGLFLRYRDVGVHAGPFDVKRTGAIATVRCDAVLTGGAGGPLPDTGRAYAVASDWRLQDGDWRLVAIEWKAAGDR